MLILVVVNVIGVIQSFTLAIILCFQKRRNVLSYLLAVLLFSLGIVIGNTILFLLNYTDLMVIYQYQSNGFGLLIGPALWLIVKYSLNSNRLESKEWWHLIAFIAYMLFGIVAIFLSDLSEGYADWFTQIDRILLLWFWNTQFGVYLIMTLFLLKRERKKLGKDGHWLTQLVMVFLFTFLLNFIFKMASLWVVPIPDEVTLNVTVLLSFIVITIVYRSHSSPLKRVRQSVSVNDSSLDQMIKLFEEEKIFMTQHLTIHTLAERLGLTSKSTSFLINTHFCKNFNEVVNEYRIKEVLKMMKQGEQAHLTIIGLAEIAGFHSNTAFYRAFKQYTGQTPKAYISNTE